MIRVYDIETFYNCFTYTDIDPDTREEKVFVMSDYQDDSAALYEYLDMLCAKKAGMVGFNNLGFDWPVLYNMRQRNLDSGYQVYNMVQNEIITKGNHFEEKRPDAPQWIRQLDLYLLNHYDNPGRNTSLKALQVSMGWDNVMDNPFNHNRFITHDELEIVLKYNRNDVLFTEFFYHKCREKIDFRKKIASKFKIDVINSSDVSIGEKIFMKALTKAMGMSTYELKQKVAKGVSVDLNSIILPYIEFKDPRFQELLRLMKATRTSGDFLQTFIENLPKGASTNELHDIMKANNIPVRKLAQQKKSFSFTRNYAGMLIEYGVGGIHGCVPPGIFRKSETQTILDIDVKSYYPNLFIRNGFHPRHINKEVFLRVYEETFDMRVAAQKEGDKLTSDALKLALNGVFGKTGSNVSPLYDPRAFYAITVNGQLLLTMLAEQLHEAGAKLLQINTDGVTIHIDNNLRPEVDAICKKWEQQTKLILEYAEFDVMFIRDVNNYLVLKSDGSTKEKAAFETSKEWHKDNSFMVVPKAVKEYFVKGTPIRDFLRNHDEIYDFCGRYKASAGWTVNFYYLDKDVQRCMDYGKIYRFLVTKKGGVSKKINKDGREHHLCEGFQTTPFNQKVEIDRDNIDYAFYELECKKLIDTICPIQIQLGLV